MTKGRRELQRMFPPGTLIKAPRLGGKLGLIVFWHFRHKENEHCAAALFSDGLRDIAVFEFEPLWPWNIESIVRPND